MAGHLHGGYHVQLGPDNVPVSQLFLRVGCVVLIGLWAVRTATRAQEWTDERLLWIGAVEGAPKKPRPLINLASMLVAQAPLLAASYYRDAIVLAEHPGRTTAERTVGVAVARANLALILADTGQLLEAQAAIKDIADQYHVGAITQVEAWINRRVSVSQASSR